MKKRFFLLLFGVLFLSSACCMKPDLRPAAGDLSANLLTLKRDYDKGYIKLKKNECKGRSNYIEGTIAKITSDVSAADPECSFNDLQPLFVDLKSRFSRLRKDYTTSLYRPRPSKVENKKSLIRRMDLFDESLRLIKTSLQEETP
jgi:hypothetical protein